MNATVISIINNKGGVGKTMTAHNLSAALAAKGKKVCMIDFDSQHNLTNRCENPDREDPALIDHNYTGRSIEDYLEDTTLEISPIIVKKNLSLIPATIRLAELSAKLYGMKKSEGPSDRLKLLCSDLQETYDFIIVDSEPGMSALMVNATKAADIIIIPVSCMDALSGAGEGVFGIMDSNFLNTPYYFLQTMYEGRLRSSRDIRSTLLEDACDHTFRTYIKRNEYLNSAGEIGKDIFEYLPKSGGATDYKDLATEIISILKKNNPKQ